jgi:two-component system chemotaxis sensor kinase CheA
MVNLAGELVTLQSRYRQLAEDRGDAELGELNENLESLIRHLRGLAMEMHMVPLEVLFAGYQRLVHDLCRQLGKQAVLETTGTETELEKNIIEELRDPLLHLIRNAMDHGIESPAGREAAGKDPIGRLRLSARCEGGSVLITVEDDGAGMDLAAIARKAVERKLIASAASMDAAAIRQLVFLPGFSTAATVSAVSGRGVGMDVVKRSVEGLRGGIRLEDRPGGGTRVQLRIPLSLTVIEALILRIGGDSYAINLAAIRECRNLASLTGLARGGTVVYGGRPAACIDLGRFFDPAAAPRREGVVVLVGDGRKTVGLLVDEVRHTVQAVIKPLGRSFAASRGVNGAVVLGDGSLALVIDAEHFLEMGGPGN